MFTQLIRQRLIVEKRTDFINLEYSAVSQLFRHADLARRAHVLEPVSSNNHPVAGRALTLAECHACKYIGQLDAERLNGSIKKAVKRIADSLVLKHILIHAEIVEHVRANQLHLRSVNHKRRSLNLLNVAISVREQQQTAASVALKILTAEALALLRNVLRLREIAHFRHEPVGAAVSDALPESLLVQVNQAHRCV